MVGHSPPLHSLGAILTRTLSSSRWCHCPRSSCSRGRRWSWPGPRSGGWSGSSWRGQDSPGADTASPHTLGPRAPTWTPPCSSAGQILKRNETLKKTKVFLAETDGNKIKQKRDCIILSSYRDQTYVNSHMWHILFSAGGRNKNCHYQTTGKFE